MRNLFNFIVKNVHWLLFLLLVFISVSLIVNNNQFQRSKYLSAVQDITGRVFSVINAFQSYMHLNTENANLTKRIAELETETYAYRKIIEQMSDSVQTAVMEIDSIHTLIYQFVPAKIVYNSVSRLDNYMTLNKGSNDGIEPDMGVISENGKGVVGVILKTSAHYSIVIPILNPKFRLNCKLKNNNYGGPLLWDGNDSRYTYLTGLARHVDFEIGDTIVTSGNSIIFPEGIPVGSIVDSQKQKNDNYNSLKIKLFTNLSTTTNVIIVSNKYQKEQKKLQELIDN